jgi:hypothetical protein
VKVESVIPPLQSGQRQVSAITSDNNTDTVLGGFFTAFSFLADRRYYDDDPVFFVGNN